MVRKIKSLLKRSTKLTKQKHKAISPIISVILLIVVAVILVGVMLSFGQDFTVKGTEKTSDILYKEDSSLTGFVYSSNPRPDGFTFKNLSSKPLEITHYEIIGLGSSEVLNTPIPFSSTITSNAGSQVPIPIVCSPGKDYVIKLISSDNSFVTVKINNVTNYQSNSCDSSEVPDLVCLGVEENGTGDSNSDPIVICSVDDLNNIRNGLDKYYKLGRNLDLNISPYNEGEGWVPIGNSSTQFTGSLDGSRYTISNLYINRPTSDNQGLFGYTSTGAVISNVKLENVNSSNVNGFNIGALVGYNDGTITSSFSSGVVSGSFIVGGLVGFSSGTISNSSFSGSVFGEIDATGGLVGYFTGTITESFSSGSVSGKEYVGGLVGRSSSGGTITDSYSLGDVIRLSGTATSFGGFLGYRDSVTITNCYSAGKIIYVGLINSTDKGFSSSSITGNNYWDTQTSLQSTSGGGALGRTTSQMQTQSNFTDWDFETIWQIEEGESYPYLRNNPQTSIPKPVYSVASNYFSGIQNYLSLDIILSSGADEIYYTTNGTDPTCSGIGTLYSSAITITTGTTTINAIGCKTGYENSISTFTYILPEPTMIYNPADLNNIRNDLSRLYVLGANIDLNVDPYNTGEGWEPIGYDETIFYGGFDGNGFSISNLYINRPTTYGGQGLFGYTNTGSILNNVKLEDVNVIGKDFVGSLVGINFGTISGSSSSGSVSGTSESVGGLVGHSDGTIIRSSSSVSVSGTDFGTGGLVGENYGIILASYSSGSVSGKFNVGGLVGYSSGTITASFSTSSVSGKEDVGGLVGELSYGGIIIESFATGSVFGSYFYVGGFVGNMIFSSIQDSYSLGDVTRLSGTSTNFGGFLGYISSGTITNCYSKGRVIYAGATNPTNRGFSSSSVSANNYWDTQTSLQPTSGTGATGKTTAQMKTQSTFTGWDFDTIWAIEEGESYPYLISNPQTPIPRPTHSVVSNYVSGIQNYLSLDIILSSGADETYYTINGTDPTCSGTGTLYSSAITITTGTTTIKATGCKSGFSNRVYTFTYALPEPIMILTADDLNNIKNDLSGFYILGADIDLNISPYNTGQGWEPIGNNSTHFTGSLDGGGYTISNLYINRPTTYYQGLFGYTNTGAVINNVRLENVNVTGKSDSGGLVGYNYNGTITNSSSSGSVSGTIEIGGLVGDNYNGTITNSYSKGIITGMAGSQKIGGIAGNCNYGNIEFSYFDGNVIGDSYVGGGIGHNWDGNVRFSYSKGNVSGLSYVGGFVGISSGKFQNNYSFSNVIRRSGTSTNVGGFIGLHDTRHAGYFKYNYSAGKIIYSTATNPTNKGFTGVNLGVNGVSNFWDMNTSEQLTSGTGATGKTTEQMKTQSTFTGWDFNAVWAIDAGTTYPYLRSITYDESNPKPT